MKPPSETGRRSRGFDHPTGSIAAAAALHNTPGGAGLPPPGEGSLRNPAQQVAAVSQGYTYTFLIIVQPQQHT